MFVVLVCYSSAKTYLEHNQSLNSLEYEPLHNVHSKSNSAEIKAMTRNRMQSVTEPFKRFRQPTVPLAPVVSLLGPMARVTVVSLVNIFIKISFSPNPKFSWCHW